MFEFPGPGVSGSQFQGFIYNGTFQIPEIPSVSGPAGATKIIPKPDGSKFYVVDAGGLETFDPSLATPVTVAGIAGKVCEATITPNGRYLLLAAAAACGSGTSSSFYILDTSDDAILSNSLPQLAAGILGFAVSPDSTTAWMLTESPSSATLTEFSLTTRSQTAAATMPCCELSALTLAPSGLLYVTGGGGIYEVTAGAANLFACSSVSSNQSPPLCITPNGMISVRAKPGPLHFTPSGKVAYAVNADPAVYPTSLVELTVATHAVATWPPNNTSSTPPAFSDVIVAGESEIFAISTTDPNYPTTLWDVAPSPLNATADTSFGSIIPANEVSSAIVSNELPTAQYLYALVANGDLYRIDLTTKSYVHTLSPPGPGLLQFDFVPQETGAAEFFPYTPASQTLPSGTFSAQISALVLDSLGRPVYNVPVVFAESAADSVAGVVITGASPTTNANGYVTATTAVPSNPGTFKVVLTAGSATTSFALTVPGANTPGGGTGAGTPTGVGTSAQVTIVSGNGELIEAGHPLCCEPLTIQVTNNAGEPMPNVPVTFSVAAGQLSGAAIGQLDNPNTTTDVNGMAHTDLVSPNLPPNQQLAFDSAIVSASTSVGSVNFVETVFQQIGNGVGGPLFSLVAPGNQTITAPEGEVVANAIIESISVAPGGVSQPVPNIGLRLASSIDPSQPGPASCQGSSLSDINGLAHCNLAVSCQVTPGTSTGLSVVVGEYFVTSVTLTVTVGANRLIAITSGNNQVGHPGATLPLQLVATVTDNCGTPIAGVPVSWSVTEGSATLNDALGTSDPSGNVHTVVVLGQVSGTVQVTVSLGSAKAVFMLTNQAAVEGISLVSGGGQFAGANTAFAQPLVFVVTDVSQNPIPGILVTFSVASGSAALNPESATTNSQGQVSTTVSSGSTAGVVTIVASTGPLSASASLTVITSLSSGAPSIAPGGIVPVDSTVPIIQPGEWVSIYGSNLASSTVSWNGNFPMSLGGTSVTINEKAAFLSFVSPTQINLQAPNDTATGAVPVVVTTASGTAISAVTLAPFAPSFLLLDSKHVTGIILRSNKSGAYGGGAYDIIGPTGSSLGYPTVAAKAGDTVELFAVGLGPTSPTEPAGQAFSGSAQTTNPVTLLINNVSVTPAFAGLSSAGLYQINVTVPAGLGSGDVSLVATVAGLQTPSSVVISLFTNQVTQAGISLVSGGGQSALPNQTFPQPLVFAATVNQNPAPGALVTFAVAAGSATVSPASAITNSEGQVSTTVQAGSAAGAVTIIASYGAFSASASLMVAPNAPAVTAASFTNSATTGSANPQEGLVPCGLNSVTGAGLAPLIQGVLPGNSQGLGLLPYTLGGVSITINGVSAPLVSVSNINGVQQVNFQTPCETLPGLATAILKLNGGATIVSAIVSGIQVLATQPRIINNAGPNGAPYGYVMSALDGSLVSPSNPALR